MTYVNIGFWSGNVLHHVCLGSAPRGMLLPRKILVLISSFISLFETPPACVSLINFDEKMSHCLSNCLPGDHQPSVVRTYGPEEFEKSLGLPTSQIIERHDYRTILDFLLMKLRTALDKDWLQKLPRSEPAPEYDCWIQFLSAHYELQCRPELLRAYKFACLCLSPQTDMPSEFDVPMPGLKSDNETFQSCVRSLQLSYRNVPHVSSLYRNAKTVNRAFRLLGRGADLLSDKKFSIWNFSKGSAAKKTSLLGKLETGYRKSVLRFDRPIISSTTTTPSISRTSSANSSTSPDPSLGRISVTLDRCSGSKTGSSPKKIGEKHAKGKKN